MNAQLAFTETPTVQRGDLFTLGRHRLLCGDSTSHEDVARLMQGTKVQAVITDPPYGMLETGWDTPTFAFLAAMEAYLCRNVTLVSFCSLPFGFALHQAMLAHGWQWRWDAVWIKPNGGNGVSKSRPIQCHEHLFAYARKGIVARDLIFHGHDAGESGLPWRRTNLHRAGLSINSIQVRLRERRQSAGHPDGKRWVRSDLNGKSKNSLPESERTSHPTQKPLEIVEKLSVLLANEHDVIYDPFLGSGTTLMAAEKTGRLCYGMELSPDYCALIIDRWQRHTCQQAVKVEIGI